MTFSCSLTSNSSSRRKATSDDDNNDNGETTREYITEFDPSKIVTNKQCKQLIIPPQQNTWTAHKKLKAPSNEDLPPDHSVIPNSIETMMLQKLKDDLQNLPDDRGYDEFIDVPVEAFGAALLTGYGWSEGKGIGRNAKEDVKVVQYARWVGRQGLGFKPETNDTVVNSPLAKDADQWIRNRSIYWRNCTSSYSLTEGSSYNKTISSEDGILAATDRESLIMTVRLSSFF